MPGGPLALAIFTPIPQKVVARALGRLRRRMRRNLRPATGTGRGGEPGSMTWRLRGGAGEIRGIALPRELSERKGKRVSVSRRPLSRAAASPPPLPRFPSPEWEWSRASGSAGEPPPYAPGARTRRGRGEQWGAGLAAPAGRGTLSSRVYRS